MERWHNKVAVVTGASSGIGEGIVRGLLAENLQVVGLARRIDRLQQLASDVADLPGKFHPIQTDITKEDDILNAFKWIATNLGGIDILINNAGIARSSSLSDGQTQDWMDVMNTNVMGLCIASREAVKLMKEKNITEGQIIHINSVLGHILPSGFVKSFNVYPASKHAVTALTESLRAELISSQLPIKVASISPGYVQTEIAEKSGLKGVDFSAFPALQPSDISYAVVSILGASPSCNICEMIVRPEKELF